METNMRQVTQQEFYAALYAASTPANDIMKVRNPALFGVSCGDEYFLAVA